MEKIYSRVYENTNIAIIPFNQFDVNKNISNFLVHEKDIIGDWSSTGLASKIKLHDKFIGVDKDTIYPSKWEGYFWVGIVPTFTYPVQDKKTLSKRKLNACKLWQDLHKIHFKNECRISFSDILASNFKGYSKKEREYLEKYFKDLENNWEDASADFKIEKKENFKGYVALKKPEDKKINDPPDLDPKWDEALTKDTYKVKVDEDLVFDEEGWDQF